jgi:hypothetical protein
MYVYMYICIYIYIYVCIYAHTHTHTHTHTSAIEKLGDYLRLEWQKKRGPGSDADRAAGYMASYATTYLSSYCYGIAAGYVASYATTYLSSYGSDADRAAGYVASYATTYLSSYCYGIAAGYVASYTTTYLSSYCSDADRAAGYVASYTTTTYLSSYCYVSVLILVHMCPHSERERAAGGAQVPAAGVGVAADEERAEADEEGPRRLGRIAARALCVPQQAIFFFPPAASCFTLLLTCACRSRRAA